MTMLRYFIFSCLFTLFSSCNGSQRSCGIDNGVRRGYILGGYAVPENGYPWVVSIRLKSTGSHLCAGTLISAKFVLTAGHCMFDNNGTIRRALDVFVVAGAHRLKERGENEKTLFTEKIHVHARFRSRSVRKWSYDVAILQLRNRHYISRVARPVCLPTASEPLPKETCLALGWGQTATSRHSDVLQGVTVPVVDRPTCNSKNFWDGYIDRTMLCAGRVATSTQRVGASVCQGDSGGPLLCPKGRLNQWTLYGVVSWGPVLCDEKPAVFANLALFRNWIIAILRANGGEFHNIESGFARRTTKSTLSPSVTDFGNVSTRLPPCDATHFQRLPGKSLRMAAPSQVLDGVSVKRCLLQCCRQPQHQCRAFVYNVRNKRCELMKVSSCDVQPSRGQQATRIESNSILFERRTGC